MIFCYLLGFKKFPQGRGATEALFLNVLQVMNVRQVMNQLNSFLIKNVLNQNVTYSEKKEHTPGQYDLLADPVKARAYSTKIVVIHSLIP